MATIDWKSGTAGLVYPAGTYKVRVISWERTKAGTGTEQILWQAEIIEPEEHRGRSIREYTALTNAALWRTAKLVGGCGINVAELGTMDTDTQDFEAICTSCKERTAFWHVQEEVGQNGSPRNRIVDYKQDPDQEVKEPLKVKDIAWT